jgi:DUF1365 family protein
MSKYSAAYTGSVVHVRHRPAAHQLRYRVFYLLLDLDELPTLDHRLRLFSYNRRGLFSFHDRDHGPRDGSNVRDWVETQLHDAGLSTDGGRISVLCMPRIFGYAFNPLSVYFCHDRAGALTAVLYEVSNTFRESHTYLVPIVRDSPDTLQHVFDKVFYVSPFIPMDCRYDVSLHPPGLHTSITIRESDPDGPLLAATFQGSLKPLGDAFLAGALIRYPLLTLKVVAGIHWNAVRLWLKGVPIFRHPPKPANPVTIVPHVDP